MNEKKFWKSLIKYMDLEAYKNNEIDTIEGGRIVTTDTDIWDVTIIAKKKGSLQKEFQFLGSSDKKVKK